jgi:membrane-associated phospholipid phosphatase
MTGILFPAARFLSSAINPIFVVLWLGALVYERRRGRAGLAQYALASILGVVVSYLVVHGFRWLKLWPAYPEFPSGHEAFAASLGTSLALGNVRWLVVVVPLLAVLGVALVCAHYHVPLDIAGALVASPIITWCCHLLWKKKARIAQA